MTFLLHKQSARLLMTFLLLANLGGCAILRDFQPSVAIQPTTPEEYIALQRGDILTTGSLSGRTMQTIRVTGLDMEACVLPASAQCIEALASAPGISDERRLSVLAELWLQRAMSMSTSAPADADIATGIAPWMEAARHAYGYLFFTVRSPGDRAFEDRQTQVRDWYNYAVQEAVTRLFKARSAQTEMASANDRTGFQLGEWAWHVELNVRLPSAEAVPSELLPAASLAFLGLRSTYRRDGFGAELVAVTDSNQVTLSATPDELVSQPGLRQQRRKTLPPAWSEMPSPNITVVFRFPGQTLDEVLAARDVIVSVHDPLVEKELVLQGQHVPLSGNFTAGYGLWLARSGFNRQSLRSLFGRAQGIDRPHLYMMQPFDPERRIILMLHGLASSPEAWVNVANEILGDEELRREFQVWQIYYPTNMPVAINHAAIRRLLSETLRNVDPQGQTQASDGLVLVGHSMGGMIARLMVSSSDQQLWDWALSNREVEPGRLERVRPVLDPMLRFEPVPGVERAIFIAAPHRGTAVASRRLVRWVANFIRMPLTILENLDELLYAQLGSNDRQHNAPVISNSIDNLDESDPFVKAAADLPISPGVRYHSIIARTSAAGELEDSDDGLVPYRSSHLPGAESEKIIVSGHSVQETAASILELRRILHEDIDERSRPMHMRSATTTDISPIERDTDEQQ